jgi:hypothetical protein
MSETATANATEATAATDSAPPSATSAPPDWRASLPDDLRAAPSLTKFADPAALAKGYVEAEKLISRKGAVVPKEGDPPEVLAAWRAAVGVPEKPEDYSLSAPEGVPAEVWDGERATAFAGLAHELGLSPAQAKSIAEWAAKDRAGELAKFTSGIEADGRPMEEHLRGEWGQQYDRNIDAARRAAAQFGEEAAMRALEARIGGAAMVRMFAKIGGALAEDTPAGMGTGRAGGGNPKAELDEIMKPDSPYWKPLNPGHKAAVARATELHMQMAARGGA